MAAQVVALLLDRAELGRQRERARCRAVEHFATDIVVDRYEELCRRLVGHD